MPERLDISAPSLGAPNSGCCWGWGETGGGATLLELSGHQPALFWWHEEREAALEDTGTLASLSAEDGPERAVSEQVTTRDGGRTNMRPTATVCSIAPSRHCSAR